MLRGRRNTSSCSNLTPADKVFFCFSLCLCGHKCELLFCNRTHLWCQGVLTTSWLLHHCRKLQTLGVSKNKISSCCLSFSSKINYSQSNSPASTANSLWRHAISSNLCSSDVSRNYSNALYHSRPHLYPSSNDVGCSQRFKKCIPVNSYRPVQLYFTPFKV